MTARRVTPALAEDAVAETVENSGPRVIKSSGKKIERTILFTIDDVEFSVPSKPGPNITLQFLDEMRRTGNEMFAALGLLEAMLGVEKYKALLAYEELDDELLGEILEQVVSLAMSRVDGPAGK